MSDFLRETRKRNKELERIDNTKNKKLTLDSDLKDFLEAFCVSLSISVNEDINFKFNSRSVKISRLEVKQIGVGLSGSYYGYEKMMEMEIVKNGQNSIKININYELQDNDLMNIKKYASVETTSVFNSFYMLSDTVKYTMLVNNVKYKLGSGLLNSLFNLMIRPLVKNN